MKRAAKYAEMKNYWIVLLGLVGGFGHAQKQYSEDYERIDEGNRNMVKVNLLPVLWQTASVSYERNLVGRLTVGATFNYRPENEVPFKNKIARVLGVEDRDYANEAYLFTVDNLRYSGWGFAPEVKVYFGKRNAFKGFYIAGFAKWEQVNLTYLYPLDFEKYGGINLNRTVHLEGTAKAFSVGFYTGVQWRLSKRFYLDWQIIGGNIGDANVDVQAVYPLSKEDQQKLIDFGQDIQDEFDKISYEVNDRGVKIFGKMPWAGFRTGLSVGYRF